MMEFNKQTVRDVEVAGKTVLVRVDWNVPGDDSGAVTDDYRIVQSLPTLRYLIENNAKIVVMSHRGRPKGESVAKYSLAPAAERAGQLLERDVDFVDETVGKRVQSRIEQLEPGEVLCLENLRFDPREKQNDDGFAAELASGCDLFVQDGFGVVHRAHASTAAITEQLPSVAGLLVEREVLTITEAMLKPERPLVAVIGGAKISDKIEVIEQFLSLSDTVLIGGAMANTFLVAKGYDVGDSLYEEDAVDTAKQLLEADHNAELKLLTDGGVGVATEIDAKAERTDKQVEDVTKDDIILDVVISDEVTEGLRNAATIIWNGPVGYAELPKFATGSQDVAAATVGRPMTIIGGGDTAGFVLDWGQSHDGSFSHVSTGGGASLDLMAGKELPGVVMLDGND